MIYRDWERFWWSGITGPRSFVSLVSDQLRSGYIPVLKVPADLPWRYGMRSAIEAEFKEKNRPNETYISYIDASDQMEDGEDVGRFLLRRFSSSAVQKGYRERASGTIQNYILKSGALKDHVVWVKGLTPERAAKWTAFCRKYETQGAHDGLFVLEAPEDLHVLEAGRMRVLDYAASVTRFDMQIFTSFLLSDHTDCDDLWKRYLSVLVSQLCLEDAEVAEQLLARTDLRTADPLEGVRAVEETGWFDQRGESPDHVLSLWRRGDAEALNRRVWAAQVQALFPLIELERSRIIAILSERIAACLARETITQFDQVLTEPKDVELGTLVYLMSTASPECDYRVPVPEAELRETIRFFHRCRNKLAHGTCCTPEEVGTLLETARYDT